MKKHYDFSKGIRGKFYHANAKFSFSEEISVNAIDLKDKTAVITGAAQGIGKAVAIRALASGAKVAIWDNDLTLATKTAQEIGATAFECDVSSLASVEAATKATLKAYQKVDLLVNSAGIAGVNVPTWEYDPAIWNKIMGINLNGTFHTLKCLVPQMIAQNYGRIVNIASIAGKEGNPNAPAYSASKAAVIALTKSLGKETAGFNIAVNCVTPAAARTAIFDQMEPKFIDFMLSKIPRGRFVEVDEVASMICFMLSKENSFTTGAVFDLSGGRATY
jgi:2-dehydro-3-deoxy-L-rhamnonate dehydrogenase (NAD+)